MKRILSVLLSLCLMASLAVPVMAAPTQASGAASTLRLESTEGTVQMKDAAGKTIKANKGTRLYNGYNLSTQKASYAFVSLDSSKAVKLDASTTATVFQSGKKLELTASSGQLFFNVTAPLKSDESLTIRTSTMVTGVRGTCGWIEITDRNTTRLSLLEGSLTVTSPDPVTGEERTVTIQGGQTLTVVYEGDGHGFDPSLIGDNITIQDLIDQGIIDENNIILTGVGLTIEELQEEKVPGFVAVEVAKDKELQKKIEETTNLSVPAIIADAEERLAEEEAAAEQQDQQIQSELEDLSADETDPLFESSEETTGGGGSSAAPEPVRGLVTSTSSTTTELNAELEQAALDGNDVLVNSSVSAGNDRVPVVVQEGQTMTLANGAVLNGGSYDIDGTLIVESGASVENSAEISVNSVDSLHIDGTMTNTGTIIVGQTAPGRMTVSGTLTNDGTIQLGSFDNAVAGELTVTGWLYNNGSILFASSDSVLNNSGRLNNGNANNNDAIIDMSDVGGTLTNTGTLANYGGINAPSSESAPGKLDHQRGELASYENSYISSPSDYDAFFIGATGAGYSEQRTDDVYALAKDPSTNAVKYLGALSSMESWYDNTNVTLLGSVMTQSGDSALASFSANNVSLVLNNHTLSNTLVVDSGSLTVNGPGEISNAQGAVIVNDGSLTLASNVTVVGDVRLLSSGTLANHGTINGKVINGGTLNHYGTINGTDPSGALQIETSSTTLISSATVQDAYHAEGHGSSSGDADGSALVLGSGNEDPNNPVKVTIENNSQILASGIAIHSKAGHSGYTAYGFDVTIKDSTIKGGNYAIDASTFDSGLHFTEDETSVPVTSKITITNSTLISGNESKEAIKPNTSDPSAVTITTDASTETNSSSAMNSLHRYSIYFDYNYDGLGAAAGIEFIAGIPKMLTTPDGFSRTGYTLMGLNTAADGSGITFELNQILDEAIVPVGETAITLYAQWSANTYSVSFDANGGSGTAPADLTFTYDQAKALPDNPFTRDGYEFVGWSFNATPPYSGEDTIYAENASTLPNIQLYCATAYSEPVLYARWAPVYTIVYHANNGTGVSTTQTFSTLENPIYTVPENTFTYGDAFFTGWAVGFPQNSQSLIPGFTELPNDSFEYYDKTDDTTTEYYEEKANDLVIHLYATWVDSYTYDVTFCSNYDEASFIVPCVLRNVPHTAAIILSASPAEANPYYKDTTYAYAFIREGYTLKGWTTEADGSGTFYSVDTSVSRLAPSPISPSVSLYAQWEATT